MSSDQEKQFIKCMKEKLGLEINEVISDGASHRCGLHGAYAFHPATTSYAWGLNLLTGKMLAWTYSSRTYGNLAQKGGHDA